MNDQSTQEWSPSDPERTTTLSSPSTLHCAPDLALISLMLLPFFPIRAPTSMLTGIGTLLLPPPMYRRDDFMASMGLHCSKSRSLSLDQLPVSDLERGHLNSLTGIAMIDFGRSKECETLSNGWSHPLDRSAPSGAPCSTSLQCYSA